MNTKSDKKCVSDKLQCDLGLFCAAPFTGEGGGTCNTNSDTQCIVDLQGLACLPSISLDFFLIFRLVYPGRIFTLVFKLSAYYVRQFLVFESQQDSDWGGCCFLSICASV